MPRLLDQNNQHLWNILFQKAIQQSEQNFPTNSPTPECFEKKWRISLTFHDVFWVRVLGHSVTLVSISDLKFSGRKIHKILPFLQIQPEKLCSPRVEKILQPLQKRTSRRTSTVDGRGGFSSLADREINGVLPGLYIAASKMVENQWISLGWNKPYKSSYGTLFITGKDPMCRRFVFFPTLAALISGRARLLVDAWKKHQQYTTGFYIFKRKKKTEMDTATQKWAIKWAIVYLVYAWHSCASWVWSIYCWLPLHFWWCTIVFLWSFHDLSSLESVYVAGGRCSTAVRSL